MVGPITELRLRLRRAGFSPLPLVGKRPVFDGWQTLLEVTDHQIQNWEVTHPALTNTGILTRTAPTLDIDILEEPAAEAVEALTRERFEERGYILARIGLAPKRAVPFRTDKPFGKILGKVVAPNGDTRQKLELLGSGQQVVVFGTHPDTGLAYRWHGGEPGEISRDELPYISADEARTLVDDAVRLLVSEYGYKVPVAASASAGNGQTAGGTQGGHGWDELIANISAGQELHDSITPLAAKLVASGMDNGAAINLLRSLIEASAAPHDSRWAKRYAEIPSAVESAKNKFAQQPVALPFISMTTWDNDPLPDREWAVPNRIPRYQTALFSGEGAAGKSSMQLHLSAAHALGRDWLGTMPDRGPAIFLDAEDDASELHRRLAAICNHYGVTFETLIRGGLHLISLAGHDAVLATASRSGKIEPTGLYNKLLEAAGDIKPRMIGLASCANVYAGSEIDRSQVQQFVSLLTRIAITAAGSVVLISHPSLTGISTDSGLSGTTAWHNSVRSRFYLKSVRPDAGEQPDSDLREVIFKKNNYGPVSEGIVLRYRDGLFLPVPGMASLDKLAQEARAEDVFLDLLRRFAKENRTVSDRVGPTYAPAIFAREDDARRFGINGKQLEAAMRRLFKNGKIWNEPYGKPSRVHYRIAIKN